MRTVALAEGYNEFFDKTNGLLTFSFRRDDTGAVTQLAIQVTAAGGSRRSAC